MDLVQKDDHDVTMDDSFDSSQQPSYARKEIGPIATASTAVQAGSNIRSDRRSNAGGDTMPPGASVRAGSVRKPRYNQAAVEPNPEPGMGTTVGTSEHAAIDAESGATHSNVKRLKALPSLPNSPDTLQSWTNVSLPKHHHIGTPESEPPVFGSQGQAGSCGDQVASTMQVVTPSNQESTFNSGYR